MPVKDQPDAPQAAIADTCFAEKRGQSVPVQALQNSGQIYLRIPENFYVPHLSRLHAII